MRFFSSNSSTARNSNRSSCYIAIRSCRCNIYKSSPDSLFCRDCNCFMASFLSQIILILHGHFPGIGGNAGVAALGIGQLRTQLRRLDPLMDLRRLFFLHFLRTPSVMVRFLHELIPNRTCGKLSGHDILSVSSNYCAFIPANTEFIYRKERYP